MDPYSVDNPGYVDTRQNIFLPVLLRSALFGMRWSRLVIKLATSSSAVESHNRLAIMSFRDQSISFAEVCRLLTKQLFLNLRAVSPSHNAPDNIY